MVADWGVEGWPFRTRNVEEDSWGSCNALLERNFWDWFNDAHGDNNGEMRDEATLSVGRL